MSIELITKQLDLNESIKKENVQVVKERDLIVPDGKADLEHIIYLDGKVTLDQIDIQDERVVYKGKINTVILYKPDDESGTICTMKGTIPLEDFIIVEGISKDEKVNLEYRIDRMHWSVLNERKVNVKAILEVELEAMKNKEAVAVVDVNSENLVQTKMAKMDIVKPVSMRKEKRVIKDDLTIQQIQGSVGEILQMDTVIKEEQIKRTDNEILFNGMVEVRTLYRSAENNTLEVATHRVPFAETIDLVRPDEEVYCSCDLSVMPTYVQVNPDYDGEDRVLDLECMITADYTTYNRVVMDVIDDLYVPGKRTDKNEKYQEYMNLVTQAQMSIPKKEMVQMGDLSQELHTIYAVEVKPVIDETIVGDDKLTVKGMLEVKVVYVSHEDEEQIQTAMDVIPFSQDISTPGITKKSYMNVKVTPKDIEMTSYNRGEGVVECVLNYKVDVYNRESILVIDDVTLADMGKEDLSNYPSMTVYLAKQGDCLWDLAKRFNTTVQDIQEINDLGEHATLNKGQKIIILKRTKF